MLFQGKMDTNGIININSLFGSMKVWPFKNCVNKL